MNLRVDLILESEQRSGSIVNPKSVLRIVAILIPLILVGLFVQQFLTAARLRREMENLSLTWDTARPQQEKARQMIEGFQAQGDIRKELQGWQLSRIRWNEQLIGLVRVVPENVQLFSFSMNQSQRLIEEKTPARAYTTSMRGKAVGPTAEMSIRALERRLASEPPFEDVVAAVTVPEYGADTSPGASRDDRVFRIDSRYEEQPFE